MVYSYKKFINEKKTSLTAQKDNNLHWIHWVVIIGSVTLTLYAWNLSTQQTENAIKKRFLREADQVISLVTERMAKYEEALLGGVGAIQTHHPNSEIGPSKWKRFSDSLNLSEKYPGINGIGVAFSVPKDQLFSHIASQKKFRPNYKVFPSHDENEHLPIAYIEPVDINKKAVGLDLAHEKNRYSAAIKAKKTGATQITGPIVLVQDNAKTPGFLFYAPYYRGGAKLTLSERKESFIGVVYAPFIVHKLMEGTLAKKGREVGIRISDGEEKIYDEHNSDFKDYDPSPLYKKKQQIEIYGRTWNFDIWSGNSFRSHANFSQSNVILIGGAIIDFLIFALFVLLSRSNSRAISFAEKMTEKLRETNKNLKSEIIERKVAELKSDQANQAKSVFLTSMSHELRTPLNGIIGFSELIIEDSKKDEDINDCAERIFTSGMHLLSIIEDVLDISKIEAGKFDLNYSPYKLHKLVIDVEHIMSKQFDEKENIFVCNYEEEFIPDADPLRLKQMLLNLISNSNKFTNKGIITLSISKKDNFAKFSVIDTGIGIPEEEIESVFGKFSQVQNSNVEMPKGTGLGLPITREIARLMGGNCYALNPEKGACVIFEIPVKKREIKEIEKLEKLRKAS